MEDLRYVQYLPCKSRTEARVSIFRRIGTDGVLLPDTVRSTINEQFLIVNQESTINGLSAYPIGAHTVNLRNACIRCEIYN